MVCRGTPPCVRVRLKWRQGMKLCGRVATQEKFFLEVITFLSHINSNRRLRFEGCSDLCVYVVEK